MKYRELVYMCLDEIKLASDDSYITEDHILYLISKYRAFLLRQKYDKTNMPVPMSNYQLITFTKSEGSYPSIPLPMSIGTPRVVIEFGVGNKESDDYAQKEYRKATYVSPHRWEYVGHNKYLDSFIYCSLDYRNRMQFKTLPTKITVIENNNEVKKDLTFTSCDVYALFEDCVKASEFNLTGDILDAECPIETELVAGVQELVVKDALGMAYRPKDIINNANDELSHIGLATARNNERKE